MRLAIVLSLLESMDEFKPALRKGFSRDAIGLAAKHFTYLAERLRTRTAHVVFLRAVRIRPHFRSGGDQGPSQDGQTMVTIHHRLVGLDLPRRHFFRRCLFDELLRKRPFMIDLSRPLKDIDSKAFVVIRSAQEWLAHCLLNSV
jgi:hypothetical protein